MTIPTLTGAWSSRRRAWLLAGCAALLALTFLLGWTAYAANGLSDLGRLRQLAPGQVGAARGADYRLLSLVSTPEVRSSEVDDGEVATPNATWVAAELEVTRTEDVPDFYCAFALIGPDRRRWEPNLPTVSRPLPSTCREEEMPLGRPTRLEVIFLIPERFLDQIYGVAVVDTSSRDATQLLQPA